jgi:ComF family protein
MLLIPDPGRLAASVVNPLLAVVFPVPCPTCGALLARPLRGPLCDRCWQTLPRHRAPLCGCGFPLSPGQAACGRCRRGLQPLAIGASLGPYEGSLRTLVHELKYRGRRRVAARLAEELLAFSPARAVLSADAVIVPVPLHPRRQRERGFNQSELVALALGKRAGLEVAAALVRRKDTPPQAGLTAAARRRNVAGAFAVRRRARIAGRVVVLLDDVMTTGATAQSCARMLREAGAAEVRLLAVARVG